MPKVSTQLLVDPQVKERIGALALVQGIAPADTLRRLVEAALAVAEADERIAELLSSLRDLLNGMDVAPKDHGKAVQALLSRRLGVDALYRTDGKTPWKRFPFPLGE